MTVVIADDCEASDGCLVRGLLRRKSAPFYRNLCTMGAPSQHPLRLAAPVRLKQINDSAPFPLERKQRAMVDSANLKINRLRTGKIDGICKKVCYFYHPKFMSISLGLAEVLSRARFFPGANLRKLCSSKEKNLVQKRRGWVCGFVEKWFWDGRFITLP